MQRTTKLGTGLLAIGTGTALAATEAADHGAVSLAIAAGLLSGACTGLGAAALILGWVARRPAGEADEV